MFVPKATVNENNRAPARKYEIWLPRQTIPVQAITIPEPMNEAAHGHLWACVLRPNPAHPFASFGGRKGVGHAGV